MKHPLPITLAVLIGLAAAGTWAQDRQYPTLSEYMTRCTPDYHQGGS
jgi:hypothetical protein